MALNYYTHESFDNSIAALERRFHNVDAGLQSLKLICDVQFDPILPKIVIPPGKIHRVTQNQIWTLWKVEMAVKGLRPNQFPRVWFAVKGGSLAFVCACVHMDNYDNNEMDRIAAARVSEIF